MFVLVSRFYLEPEVLIQSCGNHTPLKQNHHPLMVPSLYLKIQVVLPVLQLGFLQWFHMKIWPLDLPTFKYIHEHNDINNL